MGPFDETASGVFLLSFTYGDKQNRERERKKENKERDQRGESARDVESKRERE
jgi:hypothetical protein